VTTENDFVRQLKRRFPVLPPVEIGIGDDGAVLAPSSSRTIVVTDMLLDGVHFDLRNTSARLAGRKAIAVNLSDLAAMGCRPTAAFVSIAVPQDLPDSFTFLQELYQGIEEFTARYSMTLAGGDTNSWRHPLAINVCLTGTPFGTAPILRSGAKPGDVLFVSGPLGGSLLSDRHLTFDPALPLSEWLCANTDCRAMMDLSDGLSTDLARMMEASGTGAIVDAAKIPIHCDVDCSWTHDRRLAAAVGDGEDFELLIGVNPADAVMLSNRAAEAGFWLHPIGEVLSGAGCQIRNPDGHIQPLFNMGWQHSM
jgi:thiamine-monophosphate kinase